MRKLAVILGALGLVSGAFGEESASTTGTPQGGADARKNLADFFLRTKGMTRVVSASEVSEAIRTGKSKYRVVDVRELGMPSDEVRRFLHKHPEGTVVALGEGLGTGFCRVDNGSLRWLSVDLPETIGIGLIAFKTERRLLFTTLRSACFST